MKRMKKALNLLIIFAILLTNFMPSFAIKVHAEEVPEEAVETIDMSKNYKVYIYYADDKVGVGSYDTYESAKNVMNGIESTASATAAIVAGDTVVDAAYAIVHMDQPGGIRKTGDNVFFVYTTAADAYYNRSSYELIAGSWGVDAAFLEYNPTYGAYKVKISGMTGWIKMGNVSVIPIASYYGATSLYPSNSAKVRITATDNINVRKGAGTNYEQVCSTCVATPGSTYTYYPSKTVKNTDYTWYYIKYDASNYGYIASKNTNWVVEVDTLLTDTFYFASGNNLYHRIHMGLSYYDHTQLLGTAPFYYSAPGVRTYYLKNSTNTSTMANINYRYLSFDGNYFYTSFEDMIDDYRAGTYTKALNYEYPHYAYFMYLPSRSKTNIDANTINQAVINAGKTSYLTHDASYYYDANGKLLNSLGTESIMYGVGNLIIEAANIYGVNPLAIYAAAARESGVGTSAIALVKNNLFGYGASDDAPFTKAVTYASIKDSILEYAQVLGGESGYTNINDYRYFGTHKGNKLSGTNVIYMTDPYGGEKDTNLSFSTDLTNGGVENYANTLGIKNGTDVVSIYAEPSSTSRVIYTTRNNVTGFTLNNMPFIVTDKVYVYENNKQQGYYKVYTDLSLNSDRVVDNAAYYNFNDCYGYIKEEDLYVQNHQPEIQASNIEIKQFEELDLTKNVTATDYEDGNITSKVTVLSSNVNDKVVGVYQVTYTAIDSSKYGTTKTIDVTVNPTDAPIITADTVSIPQYTTFDPTVGVSAYDNVYGDITSSLEVVSNNVNTNTLGEYQVKYEVTNEAGITTEKTRTVNVIANQKPIINASNITRYFEDSFNPYEAVTATDFEDGDLTKNIIVDGSVNTLKLGEYTLTYSVTDSAGQTTIKVITVTVEEKQYEEKDSIFHLEQLLYSEESKNVDFTGFLAIKGMNNTLDTEIKYSIIFENQYSGNTIMKNLSRLEENQPFIAPNDGSFVNTGAWFSESLDLEDIPTGNYSIYVRARSGNFEAKVNLKNIFFNTNVSSKFEIEEKGYQFRINYFSKTLPIELIVREDGLVGKKNNPSIDNMYNQLYEISLEDNKLNIMASSHNVGGDYGLSADVKRYIMFENIATNEQTLLTDVGYITNGPYKITLKVADGYDKTKAWYKTSIDLSSLQAGTYSIIVRTITKDIDDFGELYDIISTNIDLSTTIDGKKISIKRNKDMRYRIEITVE